MNGLNTTIREGDAYVDEPVFKQVPVYCGKEPAYQTQQQGYERVALNWKKPLRKPWWKRLRGGDEFVRNPDGTIKLVPK